MSIYDTLNEKQLEAVQHKEGPLLILAGAGSGKTRVLTHRIACLMDEAGVNPWNIMALTFTNKAAKEMRERVDDLIGYGAGNIWVSTFHSTCVRILRRHIEHLGYGNNFTIYDADDQKTLMREVLKYLDLDPKKFKEKTVLNAVSAAKNSYISPEQYALESTGDLVRTRYAKAYTEYQKRLVQNNALDFDDLLFKVVELFENNKEVLSYYQRRFQYIMVDEYQDTNHVQFRFLNLLANTVNSEGKTVQNLCVVGDDDQSIYKFRGADIHNILDFENCYPDTKVIRLEENYRSTQTILDAANEVIANNTERKEKRLWTKNPEGEPLLFTQFDTAYEEAEAIARDISGSFESGIANYQDFALLYRTNAQSRLLEEKLIQQNIPYKLVGGVNFYQRKEIKDILAYLRTIQNGQDDVSIKRIINVPRRGIGLTTIDRLMEYSMENDISFYRACMDAERIPALGRSLAKISSFVSMIEILKSKLSGDNYSIMDLFDEIMEATGYIEDLEAEGSIEAKSRIENIEEFKNKIAAFLDSGAEDTSLGAFLEEVSLVADIDNVDTNQNTVTLMTLHSAKGLEFPYVYLCGMEDGVFPSYMCITADDPMEIEEERRLCYVGITRARERLFLTCARQRMQNGEVHFNKPSRFVHEIPRYLLKQSTPSSVYHSKRTAISPEDVPAPSEKPFRFTNASGGSSTPFSGSGDYNRTSKENPFGGNPMIQKGFHFEKPYQVKKPASSVSHLDNPPEYREGDRVLHQKFGEGTVLELKKGKKDYEVTVSFENDVQKKLLAGFAKLKKID